MTRSRLTERVLLVLLAAGLSAAVQAEPLVGVYYYPWYGPFGNGHSVNESLRGHLTPQQPPALGVYSSRAPATIASHIDQSHQGNIDLWALSWWGPNSTEDSTIRNNLLAHPRAGELKYAIHYESTGRLGTFENPNFNNLIPDFHYLADNYFQNPNYLKIDNRPVVFMYVTRAYFNSQASRDAVASLRSNMIANYGVDPYIVGDDLFGGGFDLERAQLWDAITDFDVYGTVLQGGGSTSAALSQLADVYDNARTAIASTDVGFIPTASPGFNDKGVRDGHPSAPRYMVDDPNSEEGDLFERMLTDVVVSRTDPKADNILMINSFNEWHEDTQIEPTVVAPRTNVDDSGTQRYTEGYFYEGYGDLYLNILRKSTTLAADFNHDDNVDAADYVAWRKNSTGDYTQNNYNIWRSDFGTSVAGDASVSNQSTPSASREIGSTVPESTTLVLLILAAAGWYWLRTVLRLRTVIAAVSLLVAPGIAFAEEDSAPPANVNTTIDRGLAFLAKDAVAWREKYKCASCHHAGLVIWSMREAKQHGHAVDETLLAELTKWVAESGDGKTGVPRPPDIPEAFNEKAVSFALALGANPEPDDISRKGLELLWSTVKSDQVESGAWLSWPDTRPPIFGNSDERATALATLALLPAAAAGDDTAKAARDKGVHWLTDDPIDDDPQSVALRLVLWQRLGRPAHEWEPLAARVQARQNEDGGWSQTSDMPSDAWATGQAIYSLDHAGLKPDNPIVQRAHAFLIKSQRDDGSWPMTSRPTKPGGEGGKNLVPITGAGAAWAVMGLVRTH